MERCSVRHSGVFSHKLSVDRQHFRNTCVPLYVEGGTIGFRGGEHRFEAALADVKEIKRNGVYAAAYGAFHVKMKNGQNFNLAALGSNNVPVDPGIGLDALNDAR